MINIAETTASAFGGAYPPTEPAQPPVADTKQLGVLENENKTLSDSVVKLEKALEDALEQNEQLMKKLKATEDFIKLSHINKVVEHKLARGMLKEEEKATETERLKEMSEETLKVLADELLAIKVELSANTTPEEPAPLAPPTPDPAIVPDEVKAQKEEEEMRLKLFGHTEPADEYYVKEMQAQLTKRMAW